MAAFGISFPKLTLCRSKISKTDTNTISTATPAPTTSTTRTLALSIKSIPSQPLHYDVSTTTEKKKTTSFATILAIDGETKQLPKNLSVFNELQLDDDSKKVLHDSKDEEKTTIQERRSSHTFTPPTSSLSHDSLSNDLHLTSSSMSVDLPQLKYAIEKFLVDDDDPVYQIAEEFPSGCSLFHPDHNGNAHSSNMTKSDLKQQQQQQQHDKIDNTEHHPIPEKNINDDVSSRPPSVSNSMKWYVSELRINRPLIYQTQWTNEQQRSSNRKLSHSVNDLKQFYNVINCQKNDKNNVTTRKTDGIVYYSTLSLQNFNNQHQQYRHQSDDNILFNNHLSRTDNNDINSLQSDEDDQHLLTSTIQRTLDQSIGKDDTLIRNESVKKKLFDILNDDELENACLEDMGQEFEQMSLNHHHHHRDLQTLNSFSSSSDDALYSSPPNELQLPLPPPPPLSSSYNENLSANINNTTERYFGRSRLITTSLDKIPMNNNAYDHPSLHPSYEHTRPSWYTSPSPQWRMDDQLPLPSLLKRHSSKNDDHLNGIDPNRFLSTKVTEYNVKENKYIQKYNHHHHHHRKEQKHVTYSVMNTSTPLVDNSTPILPIIQDKSSNLLMFI